MRDYIKIEIYDSNYFSYVAREFLGYNRYTNQKDDYKLVLQAIVDIYAPQILFLTCINGEKEEELLIKMQNYLVNYCEENGIKVKLTTSWDCFREFTFGE